MSEKFSKIESRKKRDQTTNGAIFGCVGVFVFPVIGTAITKTAAVANHSAAITNAGFIFSLFLIPLVFFGIYKLDRIVERKVPKRERESANGKAEILP